jgi:hypothetical protein
MAAIQTAASGAGESPPPRKRRLGRRGWAWRLAAVAIILVLAGELAARYVLGLGDPPLSVSHPTIEYMFKPDQTCRRFGNTISYNAYGMRSPDFPKRKADPRELRVVVLGDSVINGGALTDQRDTVTEQLQRSLTAELARPVIVGNISAGSWGPANLLAYVEAYGWFDADVVVVVLSSHDYVDAPSFTPTVGVDPNFPASKPFLALEEGLTRYLMPRLFARSTGPAPPPPPPDPASIASSTSALRRLLDGARRSGAEVVLVAQYPEKREFHGPYLDGHHVIRDVASSAGVPTVDLRPNLVAAGTEAELYIDDIHPSARSRTQIAVTLNQAIQDALAGRNVAPPTPTSGPRGPGDGDDAY